MVATGEANRARLSESRGARSTCKDAGAQTDLTPKAENRPLEQSRGLDETRIARIQYTEEGRQQRSFAPFRAIAQEASQFSADRNAGDWAAPRLFRYTPHAVPDIGYQQSEGIQRYERDWDLLASGQRYGEMAGALSWESQALPAEGNIDAYEAHPRIKYTGNIPGNSGFEDLEQFIQRIEGEAAMPVGDDWGLLDDELGVLGCRTPHLLAPPEGLNMESADGCGLLPIRDSFALVDGLSPLGLTGIPACFPQEEAVFARLTSPSVLEPYPVEDNRGGCPPAAVWQERGMFQ